MNKITINSIIPRVNALISRAENYPITITGYILAFLSISFTRNFLEGLLGASHTIGTNADLRTSLIQMGVLFNLEWITLFSALALVIHAATGVTIRSVLRILLIFFIWIIIVPFFDLAAYYPSGCRIDYLYTFHDYVNSLAFFFVPLVDVHVCAGIRFEVFIGFLLCGAYIFIRSRSAVRAVSGALFLYFLAVSSMAYPVFILLPLAPAFGGSFDTFVSLFFFGPSCFSYFLCRVSIMIFFLLVPLAFALYLSQYGLKSFRRLLNVFFSPASLVLAAAVFCGSLITPVNSGMAVFSNPFDPAGLLAACITAMLFNLYIETGSSVPELKNFRFPLALLILLPAFAVSFNFFIIMILLFCLNFFINSAPYRLSKYVFLKNAGNACYVLLFYTAGCSIVLGDISPVFPALIFFLAFANSAAAQKNTGFTCPFAAAAIYMLVPFFLSLNILYIPAALCASAAVALGILKIDCRIKHRLLTIILMIFLLVTAILIKGAAFTH
jgi:hypothetical protein